MPGDHRAEPVDHGAPAPAGRSLAAPVHDEAGLREREADEHPDGEERDERVGVAAHGDHEGRGHERQDHDPVGEDLPVAAQREEVGQVVVPGQQAREDGQPAEGGVGRQGQHHGDGDGDDEVGPAAPHRHGHDLREHGLTAAGTDLPALGQDGKAEQHGAEDHAEEHLGPLGPHHPGFAEQRNAVGDGLDPGERAASGREGSQDEEDRHRLEAARGQLGLCPAVARAGRADGSARSR